MGKLVGMLCGLWLDFACFFPWFLAFVPKLEPSRASVFCGKPPFGKQITHTSCHGDTLVQTSLEKLDSNLRMRLFHAH